MGSDGDLPINSSVVWQENHWPGKQKACALFLQLRSVITCLQARCHSSSCQIVLIYNMRALYWEIIKILSSRIITTSHILGIQNEKRCAKYAVHLGKNKRK